MCLLPKDDQDEKCVTFINMHCYSYFLSLFARRYKFLAINLYSCLKNLHIAIWQMFLCLEYRTKAPEYFRNLTKTLFP